MRGPGPAPHSLRGPVLFLVPRFLPAHGHSLSGSGSGASAMHFRHPELPHRPAPQGRVGNKKPTQKTHLKKPTKNGFFGFCFKCLIFYENNTNFFLFETDFL
jgi:hypothetical protein